MVVNKVQNALIKSRLASKLNYQSTYIFLNLNTYFFFSNSDSDFILKTTMYHDYTLVSLYPKNTEKCFKKHYNRLCSNSKYFDRRLSFSNFKTFNTFSLHYKRPLFAFFRLRLKYACFSTLYIIARATHKLIRVSQKMLMHVKRGITWRLALAGGESLATDWSVKREEKLLSVSVQQSVRSIELSVHRSCPVTGCDVASNAS
jgi:hypothetical protein